jgi:hypothetical protein
MWRELKLKQQISPDPSAAKAAESGVAGGTAEQLVEKQYAAVDGQLRRTAQTTLEDRRKDPG